MPSLREWTSELRRMRFEFHGGFMDGEVVVGKAPIKDENSALIWRYYYLTDGGRIGTQFDELQRPAWLSSRSAATGCLTGKPIKLHSERSVPTKS
jgi:hypothetical protein